MALEDDVSIDGTVSPGNSVIIEPTEAATNAWHLRFLTVSGEHELYLEIDEDDDGNAERSINIEGDTEPVQYVDSDVTLVKDGSYVKRLRLENTGSSDIDFIGNGIEISQ